LLRNFYNLVEKNKKNQGLYIFSTKFHFSFLLSEPKRPRRPTLLLISIQSTTIRRRFRCPRPTFHGGWAPRSQRTGQSPQLPPSKQRCPSFTTPSPPSASPSSPPERVRAPAAHLRKLLGCGFYLLGGQPTRLKWFWSSVVNCGDLCR
jgi:hypothetical protein